MIGSTFLKPLPTAHLHLRRDLSPETSKNTYPVQSITAYYKLLLRTTIPQSITPYYKEPQLYTKYYSILSGPAECYTPALLRLIVATHETSSTLSGPTCGMQSTKYCASHEILPSKFDDNPTINRSMDSSSRPHRLEELTRPILERRFAFFWKNSTSRAPEFGQNFRKCCACPEK